MTAIYAKHLPYGDGHLGTVFDTMEHAGAPTIRVVEWSGRLLALEGSHRLAAAHALGIAPKIVVLQADTGGCEQFFDRAIKRLPVWEFPFVWIMDAQGLQ